MSASPVTLARASRWARLRASRGSSGEAGGGGPATGGARRAAGAGRAGPLALESASEAAVAPSGIARKRAGLTVPSAKIIATA